MNTFTFEQAVVARLNETPTWNLEQAQLALRTLWRVSPAVKSDLSGEAVKQFLKLLEENLKSAKFTFFHLPQVLVLYTEACNTIFNKTDFVEDVIKPLTNTSEATTMSNNFEAPKTVSIFTDGSCNVPARTGGWGVHISLEGTDKTKDLSGSAKDTTNQRMELEAMLQAIKAVDVSKSGYQYEFITDSKYVLQVMANQLKYETSSYKKVANVSKLQEIFQAMSDRGIIFDSTTDGAAGFKAINSGDTAHIANGGIVVFKWVKGHSDHPGNDKADKLALDARKLLDKTGKESTDASGSKPDQKAVVEVSETPVVVEEPIVVVDEPPVVIEDAMQDIADQLTEALAVPEPEYNVVEDIETSVTSIMDEIMAHPVIPSKERFSDMLEDLDKDVEEPLEHGDAKDAVHDSNFDLWQSQIQESDELKTLTEFFGIEPSDIIVSRDTYESFYEDVRVEFDLKNISEALFKVAERYFRWLPSLLLEEELDAMEHKDTSAEARRSINEKYQAACDALDIKVKEMKQEAAMSSVFKPLTKELIEDVIAADPFVKNFIGGDVALTSSVVGETMASSILGVIVEPEIEYGYVVYESDAVTMDNESGDFEEVKVFVKVVSDGYLHHGVVYPNMDAVVQYNESVSQYKSACSPELRPATQKEIDLEAIENYLELNTRYDFTYMMSDDSGNYSRGKIQEKALEELEKNLTPIQKDLVALHHNYVLGRNSEQFRKTVHILVDSEESALTYFL